MSSGSDSGELESIRSDDSQETNRILEPKELKITLFLSKLFPAAREFEFSQKK
jgi:hypothetical protein